MSNVIGIVIAIAIGLVPVALFLVGLMLMDSYKLVQRSAILRSIGAGCLAALAAYVANRMLLDLAHIPPELLSRGPAPLIEETFKAVFVIMLIRAQRVGFMVDAGIHGFAAGTGFALVENVYYLWAVGDFSPMLWLIRGLGTAVMHGGTTAVLGILSKTLTDRHESRALKWFLPGLAIAFVTHALFNLLSGNPLISTAALLVLMPLMLYVVFEQSEKSTRDWLGVGFDSDMELLESIQTGEVRHSKVGEYLESLKQRFSGPVVADMLCLLQIHLELSLRAKGVLIARAAGLDVTPDENVRKNFAEMKFLERSIGSTGKMAMLPFMRTSSRDLWQLYMLAGKAGTDLDEKGKREGQ
jgi:RsiW-degrading membrane proteinase PrsW (M82 family)